jgi:CheY-like chemotaxis protein
LQACFDLALETTQPLIRARGHRFVISPGPEPLWIHADKVRLAQCIANLLTNAAKYTESSGEIQVRMFAAGNDATIEVADNGVGMPAEFLPHAFELFAQTERPLDRSQGGLGIGLAVCRKLMEMQGGSATAASAGIGRGSTFTLRLPLANEAADATPSDTPLNASSVRVLVVDDNRDAADSLALLLRLEEHATLTAYSGADAITQAATFKPQFVLLDIGLPEMNGYEVARRLQDIIPEAHLIAVSGYGLAGDKQRSTEAGFAAHLVKPVSLADIQAAFDSLN